MNDMREWLSLKFPYYFSSIFVFLRWLKKNFSGRGIWAYAHNPESQSGSVRAPLLFVGKCQGFYGAGDK